MPPQKAPPSVGGAPFSCSLSQLLLRIEKLTKKKKNEADLGGDGRKTAANRVELTSCEDGEETQCPTKYGKAGMCYASRMRKQKWRDCNAGCYHFCGTHCFECQHGPDGITAYGAVESYPICVLEKIARQT